MSVDKLADLLVKADLAGIQIPDCDNISPWQRESYIIHHVSVDDNIRTELLHVAKKCPEMDIFDGKMFNCGSCSQRVELDQIVGWLLYSTHENGVETTLGALSNYVELKGNPVYEIQLVSGIEIKDKTDLTVDTQLVPYEKIPACWQKDNFSPDSYEFPDNKFCSRAAIVRELLVTPKSYLQGESIKQTTKCDINVYDICHILTLVGPSAPHPTVHWTILDKSVPIKVEPGFSGDLNYRAYSCYKYKPDDSSFAVNLISSFASLNKHLRDTLLLSIRRLNSAQTRNSLEDKAIDLGIALEVLLLNDNKPNDPISLPFRLRGAWLLGDDGSRSRKKVCDLLKAIYDCRCKAVHGGKMKKSKYKIDGHDMQLTELMEEGFGLCADLSTRIIKAGRFPKWEELILDVSKDMSCDK